ncbi:MAG: hypothetical protein ACD_15C00161G0002 [uncultured bacterium]|nr:MAG: hypothetical protein ACD_15C00161G0002 [uncultured bacterium]
MSIFQTVEIIERPGISGALREKILGSAGEIPSRHVVVVKQTKGSKLERQHVPLDSSCGAAKINSMCVEAYEGNNTSAVFVVWRKSEEGDITVEEHRGKDLFL